MMRPPRSIFPKAVGPMRDIEGLHGRFDGERHDGGVGAGAKLGVAGNMIVVRMRVADNQRRRFSVIAPGPLVDDARNRGRDVRFTRAGVDQQGLFAAEEKIQEGLLVIDAAVLAQNVEVGIVGVNLPLRRVAAGGPAGAPGLGKFAGADAAAIGLWGLRPNATARQ